MDILDQSPLFDNLSDDVKQKISEKGKKSTYPADEIIFDREDPGDNFYTVLDGLVKITIPDPLSERNKTLALLGPGEVLGEMAVLTDKSRSGRATSARETTLFELDHKEFRSLMEEVPQIGINLSRVLSKRLWDTDTEVQAVTFQTIPGRLASQLLKLMDQFGIPDSDGTKIDIKLTHQELADIVGTNRETVTRHLNKFKEKDIISQQEGNLIIKNRERLEGWM
ncbi:MAG: Crp/Fnr family transcriptional regulator [bacterium]